MGWAHCAIPEAASALRQRLELCLGWWSALLRLSQPASACSAAQWQGCPLELGKGWLDTRSVSAGTG